MENVVTQRHLMVERQIAQRGIEDKHVLRAMKIVPRHAFIPEYLREFAYDDTPLPIAEGQTISQPYIVALMAVAAEVKPGDRVLEIGTGSGYAAAVLSEMGAEVFTIERHQPLADSARDRLRFLGYLKVQVHAGDGTLGFPQEAPFDIIMAAAGGPDVPQVWRDQLAVGGRLVMPVGSYPRHQQLKKITRISKTSFEEEDLGSVRFVPLIGEHAWPEAGHATGDAENPAETVAAEEEGLSRIIEQFAEPLPDLNDPFEQESLENRKHENGKHEEFARHFDRFANSRVVLLGECSHGTAEFYRARAIITRRLIEEHGFTIVAVEADWPDAAMIDRYVRHRPAMPGSEPPFRRFPTWMWRNTEVEAFTEWLRNHNETLSQDPTQDLDQRRAGFYGLDMYNLSGSIASILGYLDRVDPDAARIARERYGCLTPWQKDPEVYGRVVLSREYQKCEDEVVAQLRDLLEKRLEYTQEDGVQFLDAAQNARLVASAERYYRTMYYGAAESWNLRDTHMFETLENILDAHGPDSKAVVWAHNSHIGNAAATDMGRVRDEVNIGQLCRQRFGDEAALIGFGTYSGTVAAATDWDGAMEVKYVRPAREDSYEYLCHHAGMPRFLLDLRHGTNESLHRRLSESRLERFIGVIYRPSTELQSHYAEASLSEQFDAYVWFDETSAVTPLPTVQREGMPETYPFGL